ncbi:MAG: KAP family P-loop NTPase fold protein, partial [Phycisphaerales bacterium]
MSQGGRNKEEDGPVVTLEEIRGAPDPPLQASWTFLLHDEPLEPGLNRGGRPDPLIPAAYDILAADVFTKLSKIDRAPVGSSTQTAKSGVALPTSVVCAVHGAWGAGKTSFIKVLRRKFIDSKATTLWFEPWRYENERNLVVPLLVEFSTAITQTLRTPASKKSAIDLSKKLVGRVARDIFRTGGKLFERHVGVDPYEIGEEFLKLYAENTLDWSHLQSEVVGFQQDLAEMVALATAKRKGANRAEDPQPIVIFIDDLDRCQHDQVRRLLESIKLLFQTRGVIFVFAIDREQVLRALSAPYQALFREERREDEGQRLANRYLEKFFQITIDLSDGFAPLRRNTRLLRDQVWHLLVGAVTSASGAGDRPRPEIADWELRDLWKLSTIFQSVKGNPRAIKGVARQLYFSYPLHVDGVTPEEQEDIDRNRQQSIRRLIPDFAEEAL